jgi:type 1 glutamine amidotransferase
MIRKFTRSVGVCFLLLSLSLPLLAVGATKKPHVVFITGDHEYRSELTMPILAEALQRHFIMQTTVLYATDPHGKRDETYEKNIPGLEALETADLAVFFLRWRQLPPEQLAMIDKYLDSGKPVMGFRTTSHAFNYPKHDPLEKWNAFGELAFGTPPGWGAYGHTHYGHNSSTDVSIFKPRADHQILQGVAPEFHVRSWLYQVLPSYPPRGAERLLIGTAVNPDKPNAIENPVAWTFHTRKGARSFYTSLGHPEDFQVEAFQRVVINAIHWSLKRGNPVKWPGKLPFNVAYEKPANAAPAK